MDKTITINVKRAIMAVLRRWMAILLVGCLALAGATLATFRPLADQYLAYTTVYTVASSSETTPDSMLRSVSVLRGYAQVARSRKVLQKAVSFIPDTGVTVDMLETMVTVTYSDDSNIITIRVESSSPNLAALAANAVAEAFVAEIRSITGLNNTTILDQAETAQLQSSGYIRQWGMRGLITLIAMAAVALVFLVVDILSKRITHPAQASLDGELELLGVIPYYAKPRKE